MKSPFWSPCKRLLRWALLYSYITSLACLPANHVEEIAIMGSFLMSAAFAYTGSNVACVSLHWLGQHLCARECKIKVQAESVAIKLGHPILDVMDRTCCAY